MWTYCKYQKIILTHKTFLASIAVGTAEIWTSESLPFNTHTDPAPHAHTHGHKHRSEDSPPVAENFLYEIGGLISSSSVSGQGLYSTYLDCKQGAFSF